MQADNSIYIVFTTGNSHWWTSFLHPTISHCYIIKPDGDRWLVYGKAHKGFDLFTVDSISAIIRDSTIIKVRPNKKGQSLFMINSCVGNVKQYLGVRHPFIWTPYQLMKYLRNNHGIKT